MARCILAFLACASTALGQGISLQPSSMATVGDFFHDSRSEPETRLTLEDGHFVAMRGYDWYSFRPWASFVIPDDIGPISDASLRFENAIGSAAGSSGVGMLLTAFDATPPSANETAQQRLIGLWDDIGHGPVYGQLDISDGSIDGWQDAQSAYGIPIRHLRLLDPFEFPLTGLAIRDIQAAGGGEWVIGLMMPDMPPGDYHRIEFSGLSFGPPSLELTIGPPPPLGDFTGDALTDQADLDFVLLNWGLADQGELDAVLLTWGQSAGLGVAGVPEPNSVWLLAAAAIMAAIRRTV